MMVQAIATLGQAIQEDIKTQTPATKLRIAKELHDAANEIEAEVNMQEIADRATKQEEARIQAQKQKDDEDARKKASRNADQSVVETIIGKHGHGFFDWLQNRVLQAVNATSALPTYLAFEDAVRSLTGKMQSAAVSYYPTRIISSRDIEPYVRAVMFEKLAAEKVA
jgi:hypothetical protein